MVRPYNGGMRLACLPLMFAAFVPLPVLAGTLVYRCNTANGQVSYQDTPCQAGEQQHIQHLATPPPMPPAPAPVQALPAPEPPPKPAPSVAASKPAPPPPVLYRCVRATNGTSYLSQTGTPAPYFAPMHMLGLVQQPLAETYGSQQGVGVGMSAPELATKPTPETIGGYLTLVRDACRRLSPRAACEALRKRYEANQEAIRNAFKSDRGPFLAKRDQLRTQMAGCPNAPRD